jgi:hypothetical protein
MAAHGGAKDYHAKNPSQVRNLERMPPRAEVCDIRAIVDRSHIRP